MAEDQLKCEVCGDEAVGVASSWLGAFSVAWCKRCVEEDCQPWWALVATGTMGELGTFKDFIPEFKDCVVNTCKVLGKSLDEFWETVERSIEEETKFLQEQEEKYGSMDALVDEEEAEDNPF